MSSKLTFDIKDNDIKNIFDNNPFLINISGTVNICMTRCDQEIDNCGSIKINTMTNYGNILSLNTDTNVKCNVKLPYESEGDNKSYIFKKILVTVPSLNRINNTIYDMEIFTVFASQQKDGKILYLVLCTLLSGTDSIPSNGDPKLLTFKLLNELFSGKNTVPEKFGTSSINLTPNPVDLNTFIPSVGYRTFYSYNHPTNPNVNIRVFDSILTVSNSVLTILKNKLTPGNSYYNMKNIIKSSINPDVIFYYNQDLTNNYASFSTNKGFEYKKDNEKKDDKKKANKKDDKKKTKAKTNANDKANDKTNSNKKKSKKEKFTNKINDDDDSNDEIEDFDDDDDDTNDEIEDFDDDDSNDESLEDFDDDDDDESLEDTEKSKKIEKYDSVSKTADHFVDTDHKNIVSVIIYVGFMLASILFLYVIISNLINNPTGKPIDKKYFMDMFNKSSEFKYSTLSKICFIILYIFCIFLGLIMLIYLLLFFYNPTKFLIQSSSALLISILIFTVIAFIFLGIYVYFRFKTNESSDYSDCDKYTLKIFEWFSIKNIMDTLKNNPLTDVQYGGGEENPLPGTKTLLNKMGSKLNNIKSTIDSLNPLWIIVFMLFVPFIFILSCYLFPNYNNIYSGYVKDFVRSGGAMAVIYSIIYIVIFLSSFIFTGVYINKNYVDIQNSNMIMMTLFIITLIVLSSIFVSKMITFMKAFFIFLLVFLSIFLLFLGYICYKKYIDIGNVVNANIGNIEMKEISESEPRSVSRSGLSSPGSERSSVSSPGSVARSGSGSRSISESESESGSKSSRESL